jgi:hypothetical protein
MDGAYLLPVEDFDDGRPPDLCHACDGLSPAIGIDDEIMHCDICSDTGKVRPEDIARYEARCAEIRTRRGR